MWFVICVSYYFHLPIWQFMFKGAISAYSGSLRRIQTISNNDLHRYPETARYPELPGSDFSKSETPRIHCVSPLWNNTLAPHFFIFTTFSFDYIPQYPAAIAEISRGLEDGSIKRKFHIVNGIEEAPVALPMLFNGGNTGKLYVRCIFYHSCCIADLYVDYDTHRVVRVSEPPQKAKLWSVCINFKWVNTSYNQMWFGVRILLSVMNNLTGC